MADTREQPEIPQDAHPGVADRGFHHPGAGADGKGDQGQGRRKHVSSDGRASTTGPSPACRRVLRDYHAYRNAFLLSPEFRARQTGPAKIYTDVLDVSLDRVGEGPHRSSR